MFISQKTVNKYKINFILLPNNRLENSFYKFISIRSHAWLIRRKQCLKKFTMIRTETNRLKNLILRF